MKNWNQVRRYSIGDLCWWPVEINLPPIFFSRKNNITHSTDWFMKQSSKVCSPSLLLLVGFHLKNCLCHMSEFWLFLYFSSRRLRVFFCSNLFLHWLMVLTWKTLTCTFSDERVNEVQFIFHMGFKYTSVLIIVDWIWIGQRLIVTNQFMFF